MANAHTLTDHVHSFVNGTLMECCETEILASIAIVLGLTAICAICAPFLNPAPSGD